MINEIISIVISLSFSRFRLAPIKEDQEERTGETTFIRDVARIHANSPMPSPKLLLHL